MFARGELWLDMVLRLCGQRLWRGVTARGIGVQWAVAPHTERGALPPSSGQDAVEPMIIDDGVLPGWWEASPVVRVGL